MNDETKKRLDEIVDNTMTEIIKVKIGSLESGVITAISLHRIACTLERIADALDTDGALNSIKSNVDRIARKVL